MYDSNPYLNPMNPSGYQGNIFTPSESVPEQYGCADNFDDEPPLLEGTKVFFICFMCLNLKYLISVI